MIEKRSLRKSRVTVNSHWLFSMRMLWRSWVAVPEMVGKGEVDSLRGGAREMIWMEWGPRRILTWSIWPKFRREMRLRVEVIIWVVHKLHRKHKKKLMGMTRDGLMWWLIGRSASQLERQRSSSLGLPIRWVMTGRKIDYWKQGYRWHLAENARIRNWAWINRN